MNITNSKPSLDLKGTTSHRTVNLYCEDHGHVKVVKLKCSDRTCEECRGRTYVKLLKGWNEAVKSMKNPKLLTLTTKNVQNLRKEDVKAIRSYFSRLIRQKYYRQRILGGLYVIELKNVGNGWNIHLHALIETVSGTEGFLIQKKISEDWLQITKDSKIVDIRKSKNPVSGLRYLLKYISKTPEINGENEAYNQALKGTRLVQTFGKLYAIKPQKKKMKCEVCGCDRWISEFELDFDFREFESHGYQTFRKRYKYFIKSRFSI